MNWLDAFGRIDRSQGRDVPIYAQLTGCVRDGIGSGQFTDNMRLPTSRELAHLLRVDRSTVSRAYLELEKEGLVESHVGRGTFVRLRSTTQAETGSGASRMLWAEKFSRASQTVSGILNRQSPQITGENVISFAAGIPDEEFYPHEEFRRIVDNLIKSKRASEMFEYSPAEGHAELRREVGRYLVSQGIQAKDNELLIVSGSQQGIDIVLNTLVDPADVVLIEEPTYFWAICKMSASGGRCLPVPVDADGLRVDVLESLLARNRAKLLYLMPTFQNPTGATLSLSRRHKLLELAKRYQLPVLEDNFVSDLRYDGDRLPSLRSLDTAGDTVIHQGTFSKALCPGLRLGWLVAPSEVMSRLSLAKRACDLSTNTMAQAIMAEFLREGLYQKHLQHVISAYRSRRDAMCAALTKYLGTTVEWTEPEGGLFIWIKLPDGLSSRELSFYAERQGVTFSPGDMNFIHADRNEYFRLSFIQSDEQTIDLGISRLAKAVRSYMDSARQLRKSTDARSHRGNEATLI